MKLSQLALILMLAHSATLVAGGPYKIAAGTAIVWNAKNTISYKTDLGAIGIVAENDVPALVRDAIDKWAKVPTAALTFSAGVLNEDVDTAVRFLQVEGDATLPSLVVSDNAGAIVDGIYGQGSRQQVLGFASPLLNSKGDEITRFAAAMNGALSTNIDSIRSTLVHELGHALGLDHSQLHHRLSTDKNPSNDHFLPTMFPTSTEDDASLVDLNPDDKAWISRLYPGSTFATTYGTISGRLIRANGNAPVLGANVVAIAVIGGKDDMMNRYSCVSDYLLTNDGRFDLTVPAGEYKIQVEPIYSGFTGGSSVGPYSKLPTDPSFQTPIKSKVLSGTHKVSAGSSVAVGDIKVQ